MSAARPEVFGLTPLPSWIPTLAGEAITRATATRVGPAWLVRATCADGARFFELRLQPTGALSVHRLDARTKPPTRTLLAISPELASEVARFVRRGNWLLTARQVTGAPGGSHAAYVPSRTEERLSLLAARLLGVRAPEDVSTLEFPDEGGEGTEAALALLLDILKERWDRVFPLAEERALPRWLEAWVVGLSGDVAAVGRLAAQPTTEDGSFALVEARALELAGLNEGALARFLLAVDGVPSVLAADLCLEIAKLVAAQGKPEEGVPWIRRALLTAGDDDPLLFRAAFELIRCGAHDDAFAALERRCAQDPCPPKLLLAYADLLLWAARSADAARVLSRLDGAKLDPDERADERLLRGTRCALAGQHEEALLALEEARSLRPADMRTLLWLAEVHLRLDHRALAEAWTIDARARVQTPIHTLLSSAFPKEHETSPELLHLLDLLGEPAEPWRSDPVSASLEVLGRFGGNRGEWLTELAPGRGVLGISRVHLPRADSVLSSRTAAADLLRSIGALGVEEVERRFDALAEEYPLSPHPLAYRGELDLWLGQYEQAVARFDAALSRAPARWGYVGRAAAEILLGRWAQADATLSRCAEVFTPVRGATTHVYVGEMWRKRGEHARAIVELNEAVSAKPGRVGARMNLALSHRALGHEDEARAIFASLAKEVPRLLWDAYRALGEAPRWPLPPERLEEIFLSALTLMRGNRSSHTLTYFDGEGVFRIARSATVWRASLANHTSMLALAVRGLIAAG